MKKTTMAAAAAAILTMIGCTQTKEEGYIGPSDITIEDGVMTPETLLSLGRLSDPQMSPDGSRILYGVSYTDIGKNSSCRNLFLCNADGSGKVQLTRYASSVSNARWSADGKEIFFLQKGQIWKAPLTGSKLGKKVCLSDIPAGISEFKLSPDQNQVLFISTIKNKKVVQPADTDPALDKAQAYVTEDLMYRHWDHWVTETPRTYVSTLCNGTIVPERSLDLLGEEPYELPTEPFGGAEQLDWAPDSRHIVFSCRKHMGKEYAFSTNCGIFIYDILTGQTVTLKGDGGYDTDPVWSPDGKHIAWISMARDGYEADAQRIMVSDINWMEAEEDGQNFGLEASAPRELAAGFDRDKSGLVWTADSGMLYFSSLDNGTQKIYSVTLEDSLCQITGNDEPFDFFSPFAISEGSEGTVLYASNYCLNRPVELIKVDVKGDAAATWSQITDENKRIFDQLDTPTSESVYVETVDGKQMQCWVVYPPKFDENKVYPAVEIVLGGPQGTNSQDWSYRWCYRLMAQQGYIVILPNRRGTTAFGQEWKEQISGDYCGLN
ncbi:MAG: prolyl oligopeptidase family serine peptidase, partial [Bacteroidales bacterium]|nr:prolyl oligopeptidase family serine peptidase [Bacteroidales bacterium]